MRLQVCLRIWTKHCSHQPCLVYWNMTVLWEL